MSLYPDACALRGFERDGLFPRYDDRVGDGLNCKLWVDDIVWWGADENDLLNTLGKILGRLEDAGLFAAAHKCRFFNTEISWCGKVYSGGQVFEHWERLSRLATRSRPQMTGELM